MRKKKSNNKTEMSTPTPKTKTKRHLMQKDSFKTQVMQKQSQMGVSHLDPGFRKELFSELIIQ